MPRDYRAPRPYWPHSDTTTPDEPATTGTPCPGFCNSAHRAAEKRYQDGGPEHDRLEPRPGEPVWCPPCVTSIRGALADTPELAVRLHLEINAGTSSALDEHVSGSRERAIHEHQAAVFALEELAGFLADWEDTVRDQLGLAPRRTLTAGHLKAVEATARFLPRHLAWLLAEHPAREASEGFGLDLLALHRKAQILTRAQDVEPARCVGVACPYCDRKALEHEVDALGMATGYIKCRRCRPILRMNPDEYHRWTRMLAADALARGYAPAEKLAEVFGANVPAQFARAAR